MPMSHFLSRRAPRPFKARRTLRDSAQRLLAFLLVGLLFVGLPLLGIWYFMQGYDYCRAQGHSVFWCLMTHKFQSLSWLFS